MRLIGLVSLIGVALVVVLFTTSTPSEAETSPQTTPTLYPMFLPYVVRLGGPTPTLPPPITSPPATGYVCRRPAGATFCWASISFTLMSGPGAPCGGDQSVSHFLTSDTVNVELYEGRRVQVRGRTEDLAGCPPLMRVVDLVVQGAGAP